MPDDGLGREIGQLREDVRAGLAEIKHSLAGLLPREVFTAHHEALVHRVAALERELDAVAARYNAELETLETKHATAIKDLRTDLGAVEAKKSGWWRWVIGGPVAAVAALIVTIWLGLRKQLPVSPALAVTA